MSVSIKCPRCGSSNIEQVDYGVGKCLHCYSKVIFPKINKDLTNLLNQAYLHRVNYEYDLAILMYQKIIDENPNIACAYEGYLLSLFGIEYVKDTYSNKYIPTSHKLNNINALEHKYYKKLLSLTNEKESEIVSEMFKEISNLQFALERKMATEESFDIFISYKSTDDKGELSQDSIIARNLYEELTKKGYKVFYAKKVLENRLGVEYEPIIFKALNTAKLFILVGTSKENIESTWVKNEWSRFIERIVNKEEGLTSSSFIPLFKDMNPYDMPKVNNQFIQGVDASKIGYEYLVFDVADRLIKEKNKKTDVLATLDSAEAIFKFEKIRRKQMDQIKKNNWINLINKPENKKEKIKYLSNMATPYFFILIAFILLCYPATWFVNSIFFTIYVSLLFGIAISAGVIAKRHYQKYPLKPFVQIVYPLISVIILVILCFVTMYNVPISYDGKKAYRYTTWCVYTKDVIYVKEENDSGYHTAYSYTVSGMKRNTIDYKGDISLKVISEVRNNKMQYQSLKIPSEVNALIFENYNTFFNLNEYVETNIDTIYAYDSSVNIYLPNNKYNNITVYYTGLSRVDVFGTETLYINYVRVD